MSLLALMLLILSIILVILVINKRGGRGEGYADYTAEYNKQFEDYIMLEEMLKTDIERNGGNLVELPWPKPDKIDKTKMSDRANALPESPTEYLRVLTEINKKLDKILIEADAPRAEIDKINEDPATNHLEKLSGFKKGIIETVNGITVDALKKFKERGEIIIKSFDDLVINMYRIQKKNELNVKVNKEPSTFEEYLKFEVKKFTAPTWESLKFVVVRLAKVLSLGNDGKPKYSEEVSEGLALKELAAETKINDLESFYKFIKLRETEIDRIESFDKLFADPVSYVSLHKYIVTKFGAMEKTTKETFMDFYDDYEGFTDSAPCKIEPEVKDLTAIQGRYKILREIYPEFREFNLKAIEARKKSEELEKKAKSGELLNEMLVTKK